VLFPTTIAGSLPKPAWLAEPNKLWPKWRLEGDELAVAKDDATLLAIKLQEDSGIDIVGDGEQSRQHFVHAFSKRSTASISTGAWKWASATIATSDVPNRRRRTQIAPPRAPARGTVGAQAHGAKTQIHLPGPMTIVDTIADAHYGDRVKMAFAFAALLNEEVRGSPPMAST